MRRFAFFIFCTALLAFAVGALLGNAHTADAAPRLRWQPDEQAYYAELQPVLSNLAGVLTGNISDIGSNAPDITAAGLAIVDMDIPERMLAVGELANFAAAECERTVTYFGTLKEADWNAFSAGIIVEMRNFCLLSVRDTQVELARFASLNGGFPALPEATSTITSATGITP